MRGGAKNLPGRILGALPKRQGLRRLQRLGQAVLGRLWRQVEHASPATQSRWPWPWVGDDSVVTKAGQPLGLVGPWYSGQAHRGRLGIDGLRWLVVSGEGNRVVPVDVAVRRPDPVGPGGPGRDQLTGLQGMLARPWAALQRRCRRLPPPLVVAERWFGDSGVMAQVATCLRGTLGVEGKPSYVFPLPDGRRVKGHDVLTRGDWLWHDSAQLPGVRYARLTATSPSSGRVTVVIVDQPGRDRYDLRCRETAMAAPRLIRTWRRRRWIEHNCRTLQHLLATETCQVPTDGASFGHVVVRLRASLVLMDTTRVLFKGRVTREAMLFSLKHDWRFLDSARRERQGLSWDLPVEAA